MSRGLQWQTLQLSLAGGLDTQDDVRAADHRQMDICRDVQFDELRGAQTRKPLLTMGSNIFGGGTIANARRIEANGDELVLFTDTQVYSWNAQLSVWVLRGTHMAVTVDERGVFTGTGDQIDADRAELNGTIAYAWTEATTVFAAALDKTTGAVLVVPTPVTTAVGRPRLVALAAKILLFTDGGSNNLNARAIDPAAPGTGIAGGATTIVAGNFNAFYDVVKVEGQDLAIGVCRRVTTTSYSVFTVTPAFVVNAVTKARTCDGPIAITTTPGAGTSAQIARANNFSIQGDLVTTSSLADVNTGQALGTVFATPVNQIALAYVNATTAAVWWSFAESPDGTSSTFGVKKNTVTTASGLGTEASFVMTMGIASRAFSYAGHAYVWLVFAGDSNASGFGVALGIRAQLQNSYFLYRDDGLLVSKATFDVAGGYAPSTGRLPGVAVTSGTGLDFAWCGTLRRVIDLGGEAHTGFDARSPRDIAFSFDSNAARRCVRIGRTLYVGGGILWQYDGSALNEVGFLIYPFTFVATGGAGGSGAIAAGAYSYKSTLRWQNAQGEQERSTTAAGFQITAAANSLTTISVYSLKVTAKTAARVAPAVEVWRTAVTPAPDAPFYLITSKDPTALAGNNHYVTNDPTQLIASTFVDNFTDAILITKEANPENGSFLESLAPPGASIIFATDTRVFLAGIDGDPDSVWYSRTRGVGEVASFHDELVIPIPADGGAITALAYLNETLIVFRETCVYALPGVGLDNLGEGANFGPANRLSADVGAVNAEAVALIPMGLIFKSRKGWYVLERSWTCRYVGGQVQAFDSDVVLAVHTIETQHQVRVLTSGRLLMWDYNATTESAPMGAWSEWTVNDGLHATMWNGSYVYLTTTGPKIEQATYAGVTYGMDVESSWIKPADLQGCSRVRQIEVNGEFRSACLLRIRVARDYQYDGAGNVVYFDDVVWPATPAVAGSLLQVRHSPSRGGDLQALKVRITAVAAGAAATLATTAFSVVTVPTHTTPWNALFTAVASGAAGNVVTMTVAMETVAGPFAIDVREHFVWVTAVQRWVERLNNVGVRIAANQTSEPTIAQLEAAIVGHMTIAALTTPDPSPSKVINTLSGSFDQIALGTFAGGTYVAPAGEAIKLTGLGLEVGAKPGLFRRLPAAQKA